MDLINWKGQAISIINKENQMDVILSDLIRERIKRYINEAMT